MSQEKMTANTTTNVKEPLKEETQGHKIFFPQN